MSRRTENILLEKRGYHQGEPDAESCECYACRHKVSGNRGWWKVDAETKEAECFCRPCAMFRVFVSREEVRP